MFDELIESSRDTQKRKPATVFVSLVVHAVVLAVILAIPLVYYQGLPEYELLTVLAAPPPLPPPPGLPSVVDRPAPRPTGDIVEARLDPEAFTAPAEIPDEILPPDDTLPYLPEIGATTGSGIPGGVSNGTPGGVPGGIPGSVLSEGLTHRAPPPPPPQEPREPLRVSNGVQSSRLIHKVDPVYPELARRARASGMVLLQVTVTERGGVDDVRVIRGHPLLNQAALDAVRKWRYSPTLLSGEPVPVIATVTVNFVLR